MQRPTQPAHRTVYCARYPSSTVVGLLSGVYRHHSTLYRQKPYTLSLQCRVRVSKHKLVLSRTRIIYHTIQSPTQLTKITLLSAWLRLRFHVCPTQLPTRFDRMPSITDNACNTFTSRRDGTELPSKVRAVQHRALHACSTPRSLGGDSRKHSRSSAATGSISS